MRISCWLNLCFWTVALVSSSFIGWNCFEIFVPDWWGKLPPEEKKQKWQLHWFQRWFNFAGSVFGWAILWLLCRRVWTTYIAAPQPAPIALLDLLGIVVAFIGITGWLPRTVMGFIGSVEKVFHAVVEKFAA